MRDMLPSFATSPAISPFSFDRLNRTPYVSQWSFGIEKSFEQQDPLLQAARGAQTCGTQQRFAQKPATIALTCHGI